MGQDLYFDNYNAAGDKRCINMHASYLQGYKYSKPIPIAGLRDFFSKTA